MRLTFSAQSTALNQSRLEVLRKRDEHLQELFESADKKVRSLSEGKDYAKALELLILEVCRYGGLLLTPRSSCSCSETRC